MKHLINANVYDFSEEDYSFLPEGDGTELLTGFFPLEKEYPKTVSVHLPYCVDWYGVWSGKRELPREGNVPFYSYGRNRNEIVEKISEAIGIASVLNPAYGVLHAGSANGTELFSRNYSDTNEEVLKAFCEIMNTVKDRTKIPFKIVFENLWWPGISFLDGTGYGILKDNLDFDNWGLCLDTGHLLVTTKKSFEENDSIEMLKKIFQSYPKEIIDRINVIHLHTNYSGRYLSEFESPGYENLSFDERLAKANEHMIKMDWHIPFSSPRCTELIDILKPDYVTHEMGAIDKKAKVSDYLKQRNFFFRP